MTISGIYGQNPDAYFKPIYYSFAFGPLIYFYVRSITNSSFKFKSIHLLHFIPVIIQAGLYWFLNFKDYSFKRWYWEEVHLPYTYRIEFDGTFISLAIYSVFAILLIRKYQAWLKDNYSESSKQHLNWLKIILIILFLLCIQWFVEVILRDFYGNYYQYNYSVLILGFLTIVLAMKAMVQDNLAHIKFQESAIKSKAIPKENNIDNAILDQILNRMTEQKDYLDPTLNLKNFAKSCNLPARVVSDHLNQGLQNTFHDFVNYYRVEEVKQKIKSDTEKQFTFEGLAYDSGFNSKATFNRIFKKFTGMTPSQYQSK